MSIAGRGDVLVGRRREVEALRAWLADVRGGRGRLVLCSGEPGIGKTRLAQELAGMALAAGTPVAWGRCTEAEGAPPMWPWRQVLRSLALDPDGMLAAEVEAPADRFRVVEAVVEAVCGAADRRGLVVVIDDVHRGDEPSLLILRHLADRLPTGPVLVLVAFRDPDPSSVLSSVLPDILSSPAVERIHLHGFDLVEVREQLTYAGGSTSDAAADPRVVLDVTGGNPLFVREVARAMADGTWRADRPPRSVLDVVAARLARLSTAGRQFVQAAAIVGRDFAVTVVAAALAAPVAECLVLVDEAVAHGLVDRIGDRGDYRFVHALTRDAVEASLTTADRVALHAAVAHALETCFAPDLGEHLADLARHWAEVAPYRDAATALTWFRRAADDAVLRLAYEEGARLYRLALAIAPSSLNDAERSAVLVALGRASYLAGDLHACAKAARRAADAARAAGSGELLGEAALVLEAAPDPVLNAVAKELCEDALAGLGATDHEALRARLLAQRSHLAFYDGEQARVEALSATALTLARSSHDDRALVDALHARKEACPGPAGRPERVRLADEMLMLARRTNGARAAMWGELWRIDTLVEAGALSAAVDELGALRVAVERVGGPVSAWHLDRVTACVAQAQGRYGEALAAGRRAFERMRPIEPAPATGAFFALRCALATHTGVDEDAAAFAAAPFQSPPRFRTMARISRAYLLTEAGRSDEAAGVYQEAGPVDTWSLPPFFVLAGYRYASLVSAALGRHADLADLLARLEPYRGEHVSGEGVSYGGPVELTLGRGAAALGRLDAAVDDLTTGGDRAARAGAPGFVAEARYHLALALLERDRPGARKEAMTAARDADRVARALGMAAYLDRTAALVARLASGRSSPLSRREAEVARLVGEGLTNRQIAGRLVISERTAQNHVQHILTKLGFTTRSQIAAWSARAGNE